MVSTKVYLEAGSKRVFACALDWPGWCRPGRTEDEALSRLAEYAPRYAAVTAAAGLDVSEMSAPTFEVVERLDGSATTDFGAPGAVANADREPARDSEAERLVALVAAAWAVLDDVAARAPESLAKGPRGGGRDRDGMMQHVLGAETAYARKLAVRHSEPAFEDRPAIGALRYAIEQALRERLPAATVTGSGWPPRYAARRIAWHVLDHAWEIEDRGGLTPRMAP
ncbi:MAG: hypothetical protein AB7L91_13860 [Dehalococcoidia bacterium]